MNPYSQNASGQNSVSATVDATLRLVANLPAPQGIEDRILVGLRTAPRTARVLHWPVPLRSSTGAAGSWMRSAAAAAIVMVVAGGGWGIYTHVQPPQPNRVIVMPQRMAAPGGFSSAGAMRTPQTLNGPVIAQPAAASSVQLKPLKKAAAHPATTPPRHPRPVATAKADAQLSAPPAQ